MKNVPILAWLLASLACTTEKKAPQPPATSAAARPTDEWLGRWNGVEGTYLDLARSGEGYAVTVADLDGPRTYAARSAGDHIEFGRGGRTETIRRATGQETGMKWLADETNCLVITVGSEGFCRKEPG